MYKAVIAAIGILIVGCGMGSVHPGDKARIERSGVLGCDSEESYTKLDIYVTKDNDIERANRELMYTGHCITRFRKDEIVNVLGENGDLRKVQRADGTEAWTSWISLGVVL